jgi:conjugative transfer pilus assembly protein TraH
MDSFLNDVGGAANVNGPTAFQGQSAGYYSLGNVWTRFPQKTTNIANLQLPRARAGCGGIDIFAGSFSFINASEIVAMLKAVANNASASPSAWRSTRSARNARRSCRSSARRLSS